MSFSLENKLVIGVASSALFDLTESDKVFRIDGEVKYREFQRRNVENFLKEGVAFPFIKRLLNLNKYLSTNGESPVEVVLISKNDPDTGSRVMETIAHYGLNITRCAFLKGGNPYRYLNSFNVTLFLSGDREDVVDAMRNGFAAGQVLPSEIKNDESEELRIAFDFDGILADDEAEKIYQAEGLASFAASEKAKAHISHKPGVLHKLCTQIVYLQQIEKMLKQKDKMYQQKIRIAIVTARSVPSHKRVITSLREWGIEPDEAFFLGGLNKGSVLKNLQPHIFFDDQIAHLQNCSAFSPSVHVPFGVTNPD